MNAEDAAVSLRALLEYLRTSRGFDFSVYKPTTLTRRIAKRLQAAGAADYKEYIDYLEVHPEEFTALFNTILINVTSFFRDTAAWDYLRRETIPRIVQGKGDDAVLRVWSAGCSSGEEAYTLALIFCEILGLDAFRRRVKIYATDIDEEALLQARQGRYSKKDLEPVSQELRDAYFDKDNGGFVLKAELRRSVVFGRHDLVRDAPISHMDLLACRNTLMYFNAETQAQVLRRFHFALNDTGFLFLGKAEMALASARLFAPAEMRHRVFTKVPALYLQEQPLVLSQPLDAPAQDPADVRLQLREAALESVSAAQVVLDADGVVVLISNAARSLFGLTDADLERPFRDLELSYHPAELRSLIQKAAKSKQTQSAGDIVYSPKDGVALYLNVEIKPLFAPGGQPLGTSITFVDATSSHQLRVEVERSRQEQETSNEELQSSNEELQTTNEELQSTVEELQTTNEELQSTNEEMETMNEELRSTNEELRVSNDQLQRRTDDLDQANGFMDSILSNVLIGIVAVDLDLKIMHWNKGAKTMWGLDAEEVRGKSLLDLEIGLPVDKLIGPIRETLGGLGSVKKLTVDAVDRRGKPFKCRVTITSTGTNREPRGSVLSMEED